MILTDTEDEETTGFYRGLKFLTSSQKEPTSSPLEVTRGSGVFNLSPDPDKSFTVSNNLDAPSHFRFSLSSQSNKDIVIRVKESQVYCDELHEGEKPAFNLSVDVSRLTEPDPGEFTTKISFKSDPLNPIYIYRVLFQGTNQGYFNIAIDKESVAIFSEDNCYFGSDEIDTGDMLAYSSFIPFSDCEKRAKLTRLTSDLLSRPPTVTQLFDALYVDISNWNCEQEEAEFAVDGKLDGEELNWESGSQEALEDITRMVIYGTAGEDIDSIFPPNEASQFLYISAAMQGAPPYVDFDQTSYCDENTEDFIEFLNHNSELIMDILDKALEENTPSGFTYEYNDGPSEQMSGYDAVELRIPIEIPKPSAHILADSMKMLEKWRLENQQTNETK